MLPPTLLVTSQCNEHFFMFFAVCSAPRCLQHIAVPLLKFNTANSINMEFNNKRQRLTDRIFDKDDAYANDADEDSMDYDYDSGVGGSILSSSFGGGGIGGGGIGAPISLAYLSSRGPTCEYEEAAEKKRKAAVACFVAISSGGGGKDHGSTFPAKVGGKKRTTTAASFLLSPPPPPPPSPAVGNQSPALVDISNKTDPEVAAAAAANPLTAKVKARKVAKATKATTTTTTTTTATKRVKAGKKLKPATAAETSAAEATPPSQSSRLALPSTSNESAEAAVAAAADIPASVTPAVVSQTVKKIVDYTSETEELFLVSACALG
jgi:hypothetical protein